MMNAVRRSLKVPVACLTVLFLLAAACGQKEGVSEQPTFAGGGVIDPNTGELIDPNTGEPISGGSGSTLGGDLGGGPGGTQTTTTGGGPTDPSGNPTDPNDPNNPDNQPEPGGSGTTTGVTATTVKIGVHAPLTGAAPVPSSSVQRGKDLYFKWLDAKKQDIAGRNVEVILRDDKYNPSSAVAVCKELVQNDKVFLLSGSAGTDQIQACARYANSVGVPYLSAGVTEVGLTGLQYYFATTMTYPDQGPYLADFLTSDLGAKGERNGMVRFDSAAFQDAHDAFITAMGQKGAKVVYDRTVPKNASFDQAQTVIQELKTQQIQNVYVLTSPIFFIDMIKAANSQLYNPQWVGVGITMTFDTVSNVSCKSGSSLNNAKFFAPFPAWIDSNRFDPNFRAAAQQFYDTDGDDFMWLAWMGSVTFAQLLEKAGRDLTRERFVYFTERARNVKNGIGPPLNFSPGDHYGADQVHVLQASCSDNRWHTLKSFVSDF